MLFCGRNICRSKNIVVEPKTEVCLQILTFWLKNKYRTSIDNKEYPELYCGELPGLDISILYTIGMGGLVQYIRHSLTAMGATSGLCNLCFLVLLLINVHVFTGKSSIRLWI